MIQENRLDLFETLVRYLAVKPIVFEEFNLEQARSIIKKEREGAITFFGEHGYFEDILDATAEKVTESCVKSGTIYIYVKGDGCTERMRRNLVQILMCVHSLVIFGDSKKWLIDDPKIRYVDPEGVFEDNHQRFFVFQSASYNVGLVSRHGHEKIEAALTNASDAVGLLGQTVGMHIYHQHKED